MFRNNEWVYCNDEIVSEPKNDVPKMGYLFVYDKVNQISLPPPSISNNTLNEQNASTSFVNQSFSKSSSLYQENLMSNQSKSSSKRANSDTSEEHDTSQKMTAVGNSITKERTMSEEI